MRKTALTLDLPLTLSPEQFISRLSEALPIQSSVATPAHKTFYDSFDWRLYHAGMFCEHLQTVDLNSLSLQNLAHPQILMAMEIAELPRFAADFPRNDFRQQLELLLEMRALLPITDISYQHTLLCVLNSDKKTILRLHLDSFEHIPSRVSIQLIKGYDKTVLPTLHLLQSDFGLTPSNQSLLQAILKSQSISPASYSSKMNIQLVPDMQADIACKYIYSHLLKAMQLNYQGCIDQVDSEFLHDFRVAVRRTRSGLSQIKQVLPKNIVNYFAEFFSWLGHITSPVRDIDVYLLNFQQFKDSLPISIREDLNPLKDFLLLKQKQAYQQLATHLQSPRYMDTLAEWQAYLREPAHKKTQEALAKIPVKQLADQRIWKVYKRLLKDAEKITPESSPSTLHNLRKTAKKLRYFLEFFQQLYPEMDIKHLLKSLKSLQEVLGDFQDNEVQEQALKSYSLELKDQGAPVETFLAMGVLIQIIDQRKHKARKDFSDKFAHFKSPKHQQAYAALFSPQA